MRSLSISLWTAPPRLGGKFIRDISSRAQGGRFSTGEHGFAALSCLVPLSFYNSWHLYDIIGTPYVVVDWMTLLAWEGRLEDIEIVDGGLQLAALGYWSALNDTPFTTSGTPSDPAGSVRDMLAAAVAANPDQLNDSTALIQDTGLDLPDEVFTDANMAESIDHLAGLGDTAARVFETGVTDDQMLYYRPRASAGQAWYADLDSLKLQRTIKDLYNATYALYNTSSYTATATDPFSVLRYGLTRTQKIDANTTDATQAGYLRDTALADKKTPAPRASFALTKVYNINGVAFPPFVVRNGDTLTGRNLAPTLSTEIDRIRTFRVAETEFEIDPGVLTVTPEAHLPTLDFLVARNAAGIR